MTTLPSSPNSSGSDNGEPGPFEHEWADRVESDRVWSPEGGAGLRFTPIDDEPTAEQLPPSAWTVPDVADGRVSGNRSPSRVSLFVAACLVMALLGAAVGAALGSRNAD